MSAEEKYYKVSEGELIAIADAIRFQSGSNKTYQLKDMPKVIKAMAVLPSGSAETSVIAAPKNIMSEASGHLPTYEQGLGRSVVPTINKITTTAFGVLSLE